MKISFPAPASNLSKQQAATTVPINKTDFDLTTADGKNQLLRSRLFNSLDNKSPEYIVAFCKNELVGISGIVDAHADEQLAKENLLNNYRQVDLTNPAQQHSFINTRPTQIQELIDLFTNRKDGKLAYQNINRVAAKYTKSLLEIIATLEDKPSSFAANQKTNSKSDEKIVNNITQILRESNKWYRENYIKNIRAKKTNDNTTLQVQLGRDGGSMGRDNKVTIKLTPSSVFTQPANQLNSQSDRQDQQLIVKSTS